MFYKLVSTAIVVISVMACRVDASAAEAAKRDRPRMTQPHVNVLGRFRLDSDRDPILVPVRVGDRFYRFILDTGAPGVTYDRLLRQHLGASRGTVNSTSPIGVTEFELCDATDAYLGRINIRTKARVRCTDLGNLRRAGIEAHGVIGMGVLGRYVFEIDPDNRCVALTTSVSSVAAGGIPITTMNGLPSLTARVAGYGEEQFIIDTGCAGAADGSLPARSFGALAAKGLVRQQSTTTGYNETGEISTSIGTIASMSIAGIQHRDLRFSSHPGAIPGLLGLAFWCRYIVTFDFPNSVIYLKKSRQFDERIGDVPSGFTLRRGFGETLVDTVEPASVAAQAGLRGAETLVSVDGVEASSAPLFALRTALRQPGEHRLICARAGDRYLVRLRTPRQPDNGSQARGSHPSEWRENKPRTPQ